MNAQVAFSGGQRSERSARACWRSEGKGCWGAEARVVGYCVRAQAGRTLKTDLGKTLIHRGIPER